MRFFKIPLIVILSLSIIIVLISSIVFSVRAVIIKSVVNDYLVQHNSELTCVAMHVDENLTLIFSKLCIKSPLAIMEITDAKLQWQASLNFDIAELVKSIKINNIKVLGTTDLFHDNNSHPAVQSKSKQQIFAGIPDQIKAMMTDVRQSLLLIPFPVEISNFDYVPFYAKVNGKTSNYSGKFSYADKELSLTVTDVENIKSFTIEVMPKGKGVIVDVVAELGLVKLFLASHQVSFPNHLQQELSVSGTLTSELTWNEVKLMSTNQLENFTVESAKGVSASGPFKVSGTIAWQSDLTDDSLQIEFNEKSHVNVEYEQQKIIKFAQRQNLPVQVINLLKDNEFERAVIKPLGNLTIAFSQAGIFIDGIDIGLDDYLATNINSITTSNKVKLALRDISLNYFNESSVKLTRASNAEVSTNTMGRYFNQAEFSLEAQLYFANLLSLSKEPLFIKSRGKLKNNSKNWQIDLAPTTNIALDNISFLVEKGQDKQKASAKNLMANLHGNISLAKQYHAKRSIEKGEPSTLNNIDLALQFDSEITNAKLSKILQIDKLNVSASINGQLSDISINAQTLANDITIIKLKASGDVFEPKVELGVDELLLTDLLALNLNIPLQLELIDGMLSYRLSGQLRDLKQLMNNALTMSISLTDITGQVEGTWVQGLNYQQTFMLKSKQLTSMVSEHKSAHNLSIDRIESISPIVNFYTKTAVQLKENHRMPRITLADVNGEMLGGSFQINKALWPIQNEHSVKVQLKGIDLEKLLELDPQKGIVVTGKVSGYLPVYFASKPFLIREGELHNVSNGVIQVMNNPAVAELKASSTELKLAFDALQNLHYHHLTSEVSMAEDGYMLLATKIKGRNPDLDNEVNLNLNLSYDLLGLLESLDITKQMEEKIIKQSQQSIKKN